MADPRSARYHSDPAYRARINALAAEDVARITAEQVATVRRIMAGAGSEQTAPPVGVAPLPPKPPRRRRAPARPAQS